MKKIFIILTLASLLLVGCADMGEPIGTQPSATTAVTTDARDVIETPEKYTELELKVRKAIWAAVKDSVREDLTINDIDIYKVLMEHKGAFVLSYMGCPGPALQQMETEETVLDYTFKYNYYNIQYDVLSDGKFYSLQEAYDEGIFTEEDIRIVWEKHKEEYPFYYQE